MNFTELFSDKRLLEIFPAERTDSFFEALFGDSQEGSFDINLKFARHDSVHNSLHFELQLKQRPGKCLACNLTYGLPEVFTRHPVININGLVKGINNLLEDGTQCSNWSLGNTQVIANDLHIIPLTVLLG